MNQDRSDEVADSTSGGVLPNGRVPAAEFTTEQITNAIADAVAEQEFDVIPSLLKLLALRDPAMAQQIFDALRGKYTVTFDLLPKDTP